MQLSRFALVWALMAAPLAAQPTSPPSTDTAASTSALQRAGEGVVAALMTGKPPEDVFAPPFLAAVSITQLKGLIDQIAAQSGPLQGLEGVTSADPTRGTIALRFARAVYSGPFAIGADGKPVRSYVKSRVRWELP